MKTTRTSITSSGRSILLLLGILNLSRDRLLLTTALQNHPQLYHYWNHYTNTYHKCHRWNTGNCDIASIFIPSSMTTTTTAAAKTTMKNMVNVNQNNIDIHVNDDEAMLQQQRYHYKFITNRMCPYAQKVWMALEVLQIPYTMVEIPLYGENGKPDWFLQYNPKGTVPVLIIMKSSSSDVSSTGCSDNNERILTSSDEILHVLFQEKRGTHNENDCWDRQKLINEQLLVAGKAAVQRNTKTNMKVLHDVLYRMEEQLHKQYESLVNVGDIKNETTMTNVLPLSIVDCHTFPFIWRLQTEFQILNDSVRYPKLLAWYQNIEMNPMVQRTIPTQWWWWW